MDSRGRLRQIGTPEAVYEHPADPFVCRFLGVSSFLEMEKKGGRFVVRGTGYSVGTPPAGPLSDESELRVAFRPMDLSVYRTAASVPAAAEGAPAAVAEAVAERVSLLGPIVTTGSGSGSRACVARCRPRKPWRGRDRGGGQPHRGGLPRCEMVFRRPGRGGGSVMDNTQRKRKIGTAELLLGFSILVLVVVVAVPVLLIIGTAFFEDGKLNVAAIMKVLKDPDTYMALWNSIVIATGTTIVSTTIGACSSPGWWRAPTCPSRRR
jgi:hypothetical protein